MSTTNLVHKQRAPQKDHRPRKVRKHRRWSSPATILSLIVLSIAALWAIVPGIFAPHDPYNGVDVALLAPNGEYIFAPTRWAATCSRAWCTARASRCWVR